MYLIDGETGKKIATIDRTEDKVEKGIVYTDDFKTKLADARKKGRKIIAIHNHPEGYPPSIDDFRKAYENGYDQGFVIGANGQIYSYSNNSNELSLKECDDIQEVIATLYDGGYDVDRAYQTVYNDNGLEYTINK